MQPGLVEVYIIVFLLTAAGYAGLASFTTLFYRRKSWGELTHNELKVKQGDATIENRLDLFFRSFFTGFFTYQVYLISLAVTGLYWLKLLMTGG